MRVLLSILIVFMVFQVILCHNCHQGWTYEDNAAMEKCISTGPSSYGRGTGYSWKFGDSLNLKAARKRCEKAHPDLGCEKWGEIYYPKCKPGYYNAACCVCQAICPPGYHQYLDMKTNYFCVNEK